VWRACGASAWRGGAGSTRSRFWLGFPGASSRADRILRDFSARYHGGPVDAGSLPGGERFQRTRGRSRARGARGIRTVRCPPPGFEVGRGSLPSRSHAGSRPGARAAGGGVHHAAVRSGRAGPGRAGQRLLRLRRPHSAWLPTTSPALPTSLPLRHVARPGPAQHWPRRLTALRDPIPTAHAGVAPAPTAAPAPAPRARRAGSSSGSGASSGSGCRAGVIMCWRAL